MSKIMGVIKSYDGILGYYTVGLNNGQKARFKSELPFKVGDLVEGELTTSEKTGMNFLGNVQKV